MDQASQPSQRIRSILRAMDRSIDDARRKRSGVDAPSPQSTIGSSASSSNAPATPSTPTNPNLTLHSASQPAMQPIRPQQTPNEGSSNTGDNANPDQPVRLKARPKRWLSASA